MSPLAFLKLIEVCHFHRANIRVTIVCLPGEVDTAEYEAHQQALQEKEDAEDQLIRRLSVNMKGVSCVRLRHGFGACMGPEPTKDMFTGKWWIGCQSGPAIEVMKAGVFDGTYERGMRTGYGHFQYCDGTV